MGSAKNMMMEREDSLALATQYLVQKGALKSCEYHSEVYGGGFEKLEGDFWRNSMADRNRGVNGPAPWAAEMEPKEFTNLLTDAYNSHPGDGCGRCAKIMAE